MTYMIIDDEPIAHSIIEGYCRELSFMTLGENCYDAIQAINVLNTRSIDLIFLDIKMPKINGYDFLRTLARAPLVIVISAHAEFALEGYDLNVVDYLLKPFSLERFLRAVNKARAQLMAGDTESRIGTDYGNTILLKDEKKQHQIKLSEIRYAEACRNYCIVYLQGRQIITQENISSLATRLPSPEFVRSHRSYIISCAKVDGFKAKEVQIAGVTLPIGRTFKDSVLEALKG